MNGIIYPIVSHELTPPLVVAFDDLAEGLELTPSVAYQHFKTAREKFHIRGKEFIFILNNKPFYIGRVVLHEHRPEGKIATRHVFKIYPLGEEYAIHNSVSRQDGNTAQ